MPRIRLAMTSGSGAKGQAPSAKPPTWGYTPMSSIHFSGSVRVPGLTGAVVPSDRRRRPRPWLQGELIKREG